jgi:ACS family hexuronate transporter-like MFS transporter
VKRWKIPHLRWWIVALLFASTVINYLDRQTLSILARTVQNDLGMSDLQYSRVVQLFLLAYTVAYLVAGRITDRIGTRASMVLFIGWWSLANMATGLARSVSSLGACRFLLGFGEAGNYTAAPKAVGEWFPPKDRALAVGLYTAGAMVGATVAPPLISSLAGAYGWRAVFVFTGAIGLLWIVPWLWLYHEPRRHPRITVAELAAVPAPAPADGSQVWGQVLRSRSAWVLMLSRMLTDPVWYFYLFWFPKYLTDARGLALVEVGRVAWIVYLAADLGSIVGGSLSGALIRRGTAPLASRVRIMSVAAVLAPLGGLIAAGPRLEVVLLLGAGVAFAHLTWQVTMGALIVDLYPARMVATVFGFIAAGSGFGGMLSTYAIGRIVTASSYEPVFLMLMLLHPCALLLVRKFIR